jgi:hypothetical protein
MQLQIDSTVPGMEDAGEALQTLLAELQSTGCTMLDMVIGGFSLFVLRHLQQEQEKGNVSCAEYFNRLDGLIDAFLTVDGVDTTKTKQACSRLISTLFQPACNDDGTLDVEKARLQLIRFRNYMCPMLPSVVAGLNDETILIPKRQQKVPPGILLFLILVSIAFLGGFMWYYIYILNV